MLHRLMTPARVERLRLAIDTARRRIAYVRDRAGRLLTVAAATAAASGLFSTAAFLDSLLATAVATGVGLLLLPTRRARGRHHRHTAAVLYVTPGGSLFSLLLVERMFPTGFHWGLAVAVAVWAAGVWLLRPALSARYMLVPPLPPLHKPVAQEVAVAEDTGQHPAADWWAQRVAIEGGAAPATELQDVERTGDSSLRAVIRSTVPGHPVPDISVRRLSALMDVPEDLITVGPVPGRGASVRLLTVGQVEESDPYSVWTQRIAPVAMPGATITAINVGRMRPADAVVD